MPKGHGRITLEGTLGVWSARRQPKEHLESEAPISLESWFVQDSKDGKRRESQLASGERHLRRVCGWRGGEVPGLMPGKRFTLTRAEVIDCLVLNPWKSPAVRLLVGGPR